jgi:hypothetical protein
MEQSASVGDEAMAEQEQMEAVERMKQQILIEIDR